MARLVWFQTFGNSLSNGPDTIFAIGSCPIDFTHAGLLLLKDQGKLELNDPITTFFEDVPDEKKSITIRHLMTGASGLPDFHDIPLDEKRVAVGYGFRKASEPNSPPHWGQTLWLVMGSGGQVSTLADIYRWELAIRSGKILSDESTELYLGNGGGVSADGDMFGFEFFIRTIRIHCFC